MISEVYFGYAETRGRFEEHILRCAQSFESRHIFGAKRTEEKKRGAVSKLLPVHVWWKKLQGGKMCLAQRHDDVGWCF